ncbi:MAG: transcriptional repressor [Emcibacter sp.]|nr:transcriptional repressor [Emcibacter sp.]
MSSEIEQLCIEKGMRMTDQRRIIAKVLSEASDHPDVEEVYRRSTNIDSKISIATVYRTVRLLEEVGILERHDFRVENGENRARFELVTQVHHDHMIDIDTGAVIEFHDDEIEELQKKIAKKYGYKLIDHRMELYGVKIK